MSDINVYFIDMSFEAGVSGVSRYLSVLTGHLKEYSYIHVYQIKLVAGRSVLFYQKTEEKNYTEIIIPLPQLREEIVHIIKERYWFQKYCEQAFSLIRPFFENKSNRIIHIHTLNAIVLASYINSQFPCRIITHLHCIPWKELYNKDKKRFNQLYATYYLDKNTILKSEMFYTNSYEWESYTVPDQVICVTQCAKHFLQRVMNVPEERIAVIDNGIYDFCGDPEESEKKRKAHTFQLLFVGAHTESKGLFYILKALREVQKRNYSICLNTAGNYSYHVYKQIAEEYKDLQVNLLGKISFEKLQYYYRSSDVGIIASLQEQCSYVAIEMSMFGLPIITTAVDGLDEMFTGDVNALKVDTPFSKVFGLSVDTDELAEKIITLIENDNLRRELGVNARKLYQKRFNLENMMEQTIKIYKKMVYE